MEKETIVEMSSTYQKKQERTGTNARGSNVHHQNIKQAGITLVALVVTIIAMLILAGVTISLALGNNGILSRTIDASLRTKESQEKEIIHMAALAAISKNKEIKLTATELQEELNEEEAVVYDLDTELKVKMKSNRIYTVDLDGNIKDMSQKNENMKKTLTTQLADSTYGTEENQYQITCIEGLVDLSYKVNGIVAKEDGTLEYTSNRNSFANKYVVLINNLDFKSAESYENFERTDYGDINGNGEVEILLKELTTGKGWIPIGGYGQNGAGAFSGTFNGNNKIISELYIKNSDYTSNIGLFGTASNTATTIEKLGVRGNIYCNSQLAAGIICGSSYGTKRINDCFFEGIIENQSGTTGGIIAHPSRPCIINNCYTKGKIEGKTVGGIIGSGDNSGALLLTIDNCYNEAEIIGTSAVGGIIGNGLSNAEINNCYNKGTITGVSQIGGIAGQNGKKIENCYNTGNIFANNDIGGIIGKCIGGQKIAKCYNLGNITASGSKIGGIVGYNHTNANNVIEKCFNKGDITGVSYIGGVAGWIGQTGAANSIFNCYNTGKVTGNAIAGVVYGNNDKVMVVSCYNIGELEGKTKYGVTYKGNVENCYYLTNRGNSNEKAMEVTSEELMSYAPILDKAFEIDNENNTITIDEETKQGVWTSGEEEKYPQIIMNN